MNVFSKVVVATALLVAATVASAAADALQAAHKTISAKTAGTPVEHAICADVGLARLDREVANAYARTLADATTPAARQTSVTKQRRWLGNRDAACRDQAQPARIARVTGVYRIPLAELVASH